MKSWMRYRAHHEHNFLNIYWSEKYFRKQRYKSFTHITRLAQFIRKHCVFQYHYTNANNTFRIVTFSNLSQYILLL